MLDGIEAILAFSRHFKCEDQVKEKAIELLAKFVREGQANTFLVGFAAFFLAYDPDVLTTIERDSTKAIQNLAFLKEAPSPSNVVLQAAVEMVKDGYFERSFPTLRPFVYQAPPKTLS